MSDLRDAFDAEAAKIRERVAASEDQNEKLRELVRQKERELESLRAG